MPAKSIMPYRTLDDRIDGLVITFADITVAKKLETQLREKHALLQKYVATQSLGRPPAPVKSNAGTVPQGKPPASNKKALKRHKT